MNSMVFSKHLVGPPLADVAATLKAAGIGAIDLTVRPGGHIEPDKAADDLAAMAETLGAVDVKIGMLTTDITEPDAPETKAILTAASDAGVKYYKLGYWYYEGFGSLRKARDEAKAKCEALAAMNKDLGLVGGYHNHSDDFIGASLWDIDYIIGDCDPAAIGLYWDPAHATIEGGSCGWKMGIDLLAERLVMLVVKDYRWVDGTHRYAGARRYSVEFCPPEIGNTDWPQIISLLKKLNFDGPISFHSEYQGNASFADLPVEEVIAQTIKDHALFTKWWAETDAAT